MRFRHISLLEFAAYQLGTASPSIVLRVERHLGKNCAECRAAHEFLGHLVRVMRRERQATPPEAVVKRARSIFRLLPARALQPPAPYESLARLVFDSFREPAPAGVRSVLSPSRHLVFDDQGLVVDLQVEAEVAAERQAITGQVQSQEAAARHLEGLPVMLVAEGQVLMSTRTTALGEFLFRDAPRRELALFVVCPDRMVRIPSIPPATALG